MSQRRTEKRFTKNQLFFLISLTIFRVLRSAYILFNEVKAQIKAGIHPIMVICKNKQIIPERILPCKINDNQGRKKAITYLIFDCFSNRGISVSSLVLILSGYFPFPDFQFHFLKIEFDSELD